MLVYGQLLARQLRAATIAGVDNSAEKNDRASIARASVNSRNDH